MTESVINVNSVNEMTMFKPYSGSEGQSNNIFKRIFTQDALEASSNLRLSGSCNDLLEQNSDSSLTGRPDDRSSIASLQTATSIPLDVTTSPKNVINVTTSPSILSSNLTGRNLSNVLKGLKRIIAGKGKTPQAYKDSDFKQYWMPDSNCKECYECGCKFTLFKRRHHCRICGQIFCSMCCSQEVPGKTIGYTGSLRCCDYCMKVINQYIPEVSDTHSTHSILSCGTTRHQPPQWNGAVEVPSSDVIDPEEMGADGTSPDGGMNGFMRKGSKLKPSIFDDDVKRSKNSIELDTSPLESLQKERKVLLQDSCHLHDLWYSMRTSISMQTIRYILKTYDNCIPANQIVDWFIDNDKALNREQAVVLGQALLDGNWLESLDNKVVFRDNPRIFYRPTERALKQRQNQSQVRGHQGCADGEPLWVQEISRKEDELSYVVLDSNEGEKLSPPPHHLLVVDSNHDEASGGDDDDRERVDGKIEEPDLDRMMSQQRQSQDQTEASMEADNKESLRNLLANHLTRLTNQLLRKKQLDMKWAEWISAIGRSVTNGVRPNTRLEDEMDIRHYVKIKKIEGGSRSNWQMINGIVFSKNVCHRKDRHPIDDPRILLLSAPIEYQRVENKMSSLEPQILQEKEFLKKCVHRILTTRPDVLFVEKSVSRIAREYLYEAGITLVINVKRSVMQRISRMTQATIVNSIDELVNKTNLGMCRKFYLQSYEQKNGSSKTLMFLDGCLPSLGCSIILRGGHLQELQRVKSVLKFVIYAMYHLTLELSFLLNENAYLVRSPNQSVGDDLRRSVEGGESDEGTKESDETIGRKPTNSGGDVDGSTELNSAETNKVDVEKEIRSSNSIKDKSDKSLARQARFLECITKEVVLSVSPLVNFKLPYLETKEGRSSSLRSFFAKEDLYWSDELLGGTKCARNNTNDDDDDDDENKNSWNEDKDAIADSFHPFTFQSFHTSLVKPIQVENLLADFRARGGNSLPRTDSESSLKKFHPPASEQPPARGVSKAPLDCLDPGNHQKISVLFSSLSLESPNFPSPCVLPWIVTMTFYSQTDITLGGFLEKFCYNESYKCVNAKCETPMRDHIRRFAHGPGFIQVTLKKVDASQGQGIKMWSYCKLCLQKTPVSQISPETYSLSFGKYLELRFYASEYVNRPGSKCNHSIHRDYVQIFDCGFIRAAFKYSSAAMLGIYLPPMILDVHPVQFSPEVLYEEGITLNYRIEYLFDSIMENLCKLKREMAGNDNQSMLVTRNVLELEVERQSMDQKIEYVLSLTKDLKLLRHEDDDDDDSKAFSSLGLQIADAYVGLHRNISCINQTWTDKLVELEASLKKLDKPSKNITNSATSSSLSGSQQQNGYSFTINPSFMMSQNPASDTTNTMTTTVAETFESTNHQIDSSTIKKVSSFPTNLTDHAPSVDSSASELKAPPPTISITSSDDGSTHTMVASENCSSVESSSHPEKIVPNFDEVTSVGEPRKNSAEQSVGHDDDAGGSNSNGNQTIPEDQIASSSSPSSSVVKNLTSGIQSVANGNQEVKRSKAGEKLITATESAQATRQVLKKNRNSASSKESSMMDTSGDKKVNMKQIFSSFLSGNNTCSISDPIPPDEHHLLPECYKVPVAVYDKEPSSIIAYALSSYEYASKMSDLKNEFEDDSGFKKSSKVNELDEGKKQNAILSFLKARDKSPCRCDQVTSDDARCPGSFDTVRYVPQDNDSVGDRESISEDPPSLLTPPPMPKHQKPTTTTTTTTAATTKQQEPQTRTQQQQQHIKLQFSDGTTKFYCEVYYAEQFEDLRRLIYLEGEASFIRSLARCIPWFARGGKSGSNFCKTKDNRFILKQMSLKEIQSFNAFAPHYFNHIHDCLKTGKPSAMAKIVGVFKVVFQNSKTTEAVSQDLIVMENLFYNKQINKIYDLKGSMRNRMVDTVGKSYEDLVLLDENLIRAMVDSPLYVRSHSKLVLINSITRDTEFLANNLIMDYSLLVGVDDDDQLVVGIIDYLRTFTWDKKVEMIFKISYGNKMPTVVSPEIYRRRFLDSMDKYFLAVPDKWKGLGRNLSEALLQSL